MCDTDGHSFSYVTCRMPVSVCVRERGPQERERRRARTREMQRKRQRGGWREDKGEGRGGGAYVLPPQLLHWHVLHAPFATAQLFCLEARRDKTAASSHLHTHIHTHARTRTHTYTHTHTNTHTYKQADRRQTDRQTYMQTNRQTDRQIDRHTKKHIFRLLSKRNPFPCPLSFLFVSLFLISVSPQLKDSI